ncbi:MAG TPA: methyltransferase domain-containing protein [Vicinamibacterales bacterium]|nr:methyltransferase domain-containing protein [Vicinamibacterales bacterium]
MQEERLDAILARLERERLDADRAYNDALTALDRALPAPASLPGMPIVDDARRAELNERWNVLPEGAPAVDGSLKGRLRGFVWRLVGPALERQQQFNAALVDHLNRTAVWQAGVHETTAALVTALNDQIARERAFQTRLIELLQTLTGYVDTKDRAVGGQVRTVNAGLGAMADDWLRRSESLAAREGRLAARLASLADVQATASLAQQTALSLKRDVERLLAEGRPDAGAGTPASQAAAAPDLDSFKYLGFEDQFRGSPEVIRARLADYVPLFTDVTDVVDLGCGRGEFLELLREGGLAARGVDLNHEMAETSRARGFEVAETDALSFLRAQPDGSIGGLFAAQVVEHLEPGYLMAMLETAGHKLRPGGLIVLETINAACWLAFFESYIRDLTHVRPLHPETLQYLLRASGFRDVRIEFRPPEAEGDQLERAAAPPADAPAGLAALADVINANAARLNARLFTHMDYAAIGRR